jgi:hypothetical protein
MLAKLIELLNKRNNAKKAQTRSQSEILAYRNNIYHY